MGDRAVAIVKIKASAMKIFSAELEKLISSEGRETQGVGSVCQRGSVFKRAPREFYASRKAKIAATS